MAGQEAEKALVNDLKLCACIEEGRCLKFEKRHPPEFRLIQTAADRHVGPFTGRVLEEIAIQKNAFSMKEAEKLMSSGRSIDLDKLFGLTTLWTTRLGAFMANEVAEAFDEIGEKMQSRVNRGILTKAATKAELNYEFNHKSLRTLNLLRNASASRVQGLTFQDRITLRRVLANGFLADKDVHSIARDLRTHIGLDQSSSQALLNFQNKLMAQGLTQARIAKLVATKSAKYLRGRAENIARTELLWATNRANLEMYLQAQEQKVLSQQAEKRFLTTPDDRLDKRICMPMGTQKVAMDQPFTTPQGIAYMTPPVHPSCRCTFVVEEPKSSFTSVAELVMETCDGEQCPMI
jgi:hypothetical protein